MAWDELMAFEYEVALRDDTPEFTEEDGRNIPQVTSFRAVPSEMALPAGRAGVDGVLVKFAGPRGKGVSNIFLTPPAAAALVEQLARIIQHKGWYQISAERPEK